MRQIIKLDIILSSIRYTVVKQKNLPQNYQ